MTITESTTTTVQTLQGILSAMTVMGMTGHHFPTGIIVEDGAEFDFVIAGSGPAGSVLANRLSEDGVTTVALIEAGTVAPLESTYAGLFPVLTNSAYDWNVTSTDDSYANQCLQNNVVEMTIGKMLGGSSSLHHSIEVNGNYYDYDLWAAAADDSSYTLENMRKYLTKIENLRDEEILSTYPSYHGTSGPIITKRQVSDKNTNILAAAKELGHKVILDINANDTLGFTEPLLSIGSVWRQSAAETYLGQAKNRPNLYVQLEALVTKVFINSSKVATGVQILTSDGTYKTIKARKEVILSAGAIKTPQILLLSGVGPEEHLKEFNIDVVADLPVGENLIDHVSATVGLTLDENNETAASNPTEFPVPMTTGYVSLDCTDVPTYQSINLLFPNDNSGLLQLCVWVFKYNNTVCEALYEANKGRDLLFGVINLLHPESRGTVKLASTNPTDNPAVHLGHLSNPTDLVKLAKAVQDFVSLVNTTYFKSIGSSMVDVGLTQCSAYDATSYEFFECYAKSMSATMWHYSSTCAIGTVLDKYMLVKGLENLRVVDASAMPNTMSGNIAASIYALAEKAADMVKSKWVLDN